MKLQFLFIFIIGLTLTCASQESVSPVVRRVCDSLLHAIENEKDPDNRHDLILKIINSGADAYPIYTLEMAAELYKISQRIKDKVTEASAWSYYGQGYRLTGNFTKALECHYKGIDLAMKTGINSQIGHCYNQLGHIYKDREENEKAIGIYLIARKYTEQGKSITAKIWPLMNLGAVYLNYNKLDSSIYYSKLAYVALKKYDSSLGNGGYMPYILGTIGSAYSKMNQAREAEQNFYAALAIAQHPTYTNTRQKQILFVRMADHFRRNHLIDSCLYYNKLAIALVDNTGLTYMNVAPAKMISEIYEDRNADSVVKYLKLYLKTNELINSTRVTQQLQMMTFESEQRKREIEQAQHNDRIRLQLYMLLIVLVLVSLFGFFMYRNSRQKQKANLLLQKQKVEIETTLDKLKATQAQLVQSEKMASLGELTAGIAHEIQNPLNFVNNFSEVSNELVDEMKEELATGNLQQATDIADDLKENLTKINHHGKRADAIVKGMLQHSRSGSGKKEPVDINALCDEYLRLAYHGYRAKDKSFNAQFETDFDPTLPKVNVMPQDIGRVVLNLINNAFYAVNEKAKNPPPANLQAAYAPKVTISTKRTDNTIEITVADNGNGIPPSAVNKIFQPFFTTKPTGQGTGLGLSLSYDIVKAHGGALTVNTTNGEGTSFIIQIPIG
jgi:signal transduction histidine kinase